MKLREILPADAEIAAGHADIEVGGVTADSRAVKPGDAFVAIAGGKTDGLRFVAPALSAGAVAVLAERRPDLPLPAGAAFARVGNARRTLALAAAKLYPRQPRTIAAVTGTSGKTSVAAFTRQIWSTLGYSAASIGTIGIVSPRGETYGSLTTPDPVALHRSLDQLAGDGVTHLAIEASSHGLDQYRLDGLHDCGGGFHQYHPRSPRLSSELRGLSLPPSCGCSRSWSCRAARAIIEVDHDHADAVVAAAKARGLSIVTVGRAGSHDPPRRMRRSMVFHSSCSIEHGGKNFAVRLPLVGEFQVENALVAAGLAIATGGDPAVGICSARAISTAPRAGSNLLETNRGAPIFVDYAHKPDALAKALDALRPYAAGRLVVVFGAGGDRDRGKRPLMGAVAAAKADRVVVTDDNPRSENAAAIRAAIMSAAPGAIEIGDRREAIRAAIADLRRGDVLLIAGKGHETGQIIGDRIVPFSDHEAVAAALKELAA